VHQVGIYCTKYGDARSTKPKMITTYDTTMYKSLEDVLTPTDVRTSVNPVWVCCTAYRCTIEIVPKHWFSFLLSLCRATWIENGSHLVNVINYSSTLL